MDIGAGRTGIEITSHRDLGECHARAAVYCPNGYDTLLSNEEGYVSGPHVAGVIYKLVIVCR